MMGLNGGDPACGIFEEPGEAKLRAVFAAF